MYKCSLYPLAPPPNVFTLSPGPSSKCVHFIPWPLLQMCSLYPLAPPPNVFTLSPGPSSKCTLTKTLYPHENGSCLGHGACMRGKPVCSVDVHMHKPFFLPHFLQFWTLSQTFPMMFKTEMIFRLLLPLDILSKNSLLCSCQIPARTVQLFHYA